MPRQDDADILGRIPEDGQATVDEILDVFGDQLAEKHGDGVREAVEGALNRGFRHGVVARRRGCTAPLGFTTLPSIARWTRQLRGSRHEHSKNISSTRRQYLLRVCDFNKWINGRTFEVWGLRQGAGGLESAPASESFANVEQLLNMTKNPLVDGKAAAAIVTDFLADGRHEGKSLSYMRLYMAAIQSYFKLNGQPLQLYFNPKSNHQKTNHEQSMSIKDVMALMTTGGPSLLEKAVFLSKWHRGLDVSTLTDRFNYEAMPQLVEYFQSENPQLWDPGLCPVPIKLARVKTDFEHTGFLDRDAISAIQDYLRVRGPVGEGGPLFINKKGGPITERWLYHSFRSLCERSGLTEHAVVNGRKMYRVDSHEFRDLLKSTLIAAGCRPDVADHVIGHKRGDSYEKQAELYPENFREEYAKASGRINVFSRFAEIVDGGDPGSIRAELQAAKEILRRLGVPCTGAESGGFSRGPAGREPEGGLEFCCISCELIHGETACPSCGSRQRRIYRS
ncbi:integrase [Cenarchaeum symbiosum A]|uniref:Integrase n=1 Tax=Cenarchaeum symbiosum (strain A) TaxID=414004 RepID=A0RWL5_CENSY|nr:integrase [Cenarchaeum symbiosum A]